MRKQTILITGASSGMGRETALALARQGHLVYGAARRVEHMRALVEAGGKALALDVTDHAAVQAAVAQVVAEGNQLDVLINNAGYAIYGAVEDTSLDDARRQFEVNLFGVAALTKAVLPLMRKQGRGRILNISSMGGKIYTPLGAWYHATKHALEGWSDCLRLEVKPFGIEVVIIEPGIIATEFGEVMVQPLLERSGKGAYGDLAHAVAKATKKGYEQGDSSPASVIAKTVTKAITAKRPKTRYVAGKYARPLLWLRRWLSDRTFDRIVMSQVKSMQ